MRTFIKTIVSAFCIVLLTAVAASAFGELRYPDRPLNLRDGRNSRTNRVGGLVQGQEVRVAFPKNGWVAVFEPSETNYSEDAAVGYTNLKYLKTEQINPDKSKWGRLMETVDETMVHAKAAGLSEKIGSLAKGKLVRTDFPEDDWFMVFPASATIRSKMGAIGFARKKKFKRVSAKNKPVVTDSISKRANNDERDVYTSWGKVLTVTSPVGLFRERSDKSRRVASLAAGERVRVDFLKDGWLAVFKEEERLRKEYRAMGFAREDQLVPKEDSTISLAQTLAAATSEPQASSAKTGTQQRVVLDKNRITSPKRPDPKTDKIVHGYKYKILKKGQIKQQGETWITLKVFLATTKLPKQDALVDISTTLWKQYRRVSKKLAVLIYLPGMDTEDLSYGVVKFSDEELEESWVRKTTLFGTKFQ
jgi:hypothetical protein